MFGALGLVLFPNAENNFGYIGSIAYDGDNVNTCGKGFSPFFAPLRAQRESSPSCMDGLLCVSAPTYLPGPLPAKYCQRG